MNGYVPVILIVLSIIAIILIIDRLLLMKSISNISGQLKTILTDDTNSLITLNYGGGSLKKAVSALNDNLKELRQKELNLRNQSNEISNAITNIAHDMRTPLTAISGYTDLIEKDRDYSDKNKYITVIRERTDVLRSLTEDLFNYALVTSDDTELAHSSLSLKSELETALAGAYTVLIRKNIEPDIFLPEEPVKRNLNSDALQRIFGNILSNAAKYSDGDLTVTLDEKGNISFINSTSSLSETETGKLFDRFYTVSDARTSTGLGLSIAKSLTKKMGGEINAEYKNGKLNINLYFPDNPSLN